MTNHKVTTVIVGISTGLLTTSLFGWVVGPIWGFSEFFSLSYLFLWALLGGLIGASIGIIVYVRSDWIVNHPSSVIVSVIFFGAIGLFLGRFLGLRSAVSELWIAGGGLLSVSMGAVIGVRSKRLANRLISVFANAIFFGAIGTFLGLFLGWSTSPDFKGMGAVVGGLVGGLLGLILGVVLGLILTPGSEWMPKLLWRIINGIIVGVGLGIVISLVFRAIDDSVSLALGGYALGYHWVQGIISRSSVAWVMGILPGGVTGAITIAIIEVFGSKPDRQDAGSVRANVE